MATEIRTSLIPAIGKINRVNPFILDLWFVERRYFDTAKVRFDVAETAKTTAGFRSFLKKADVVKKDGFSVITLDPLSINEAIVKTARDAKERGFGQPLFGGDADPASEAIRQELEDFAKLRERAKRLEIRTAYEALETGKIKYGEDGIDEIDFNMPEDNIETVATPWDDNDADPIADMIAVYDEMGTQPEAVVLGREAYLAFVNNQNVLTSDTDGGKGKNFEKAPVDQVGREGKGVIFVGTLTDRPLEVYADLQTYTDDNGDTAHYHNPKVAVYGSTGYGALLYGGVPVPQGSDIGMVAAEFVPVTVTTDDPPMVSNVYRSAPLPTLRLASAFYSQTVVA